jgi:hypothetical protein
VRLVRENPTAPPIFLSNALAGVRSRFTAASDCHGEKAIVKNRLGHGALSPRVSLRVPSECS